MGLHKGKSENKSKITCYDFGKIGHHKQDCSPTKQANATEGPQKGQRQVTEKSLTRHRETPETTIYYSEVALTTTTF